MPTMTWTETDAINQIGAPVPFQVFDELQGNINAINTAVGAASSTGVFAGPAGTVISFPAQADTNYLILVSQTGTPDGSVGEVGFEPISTTQARVKNTGSIGKAFRFKVVP